MKKTKFIESILDQIAKEGYTMEVSFSGDDKCFVLVVNAVMPSPETEQLSSEIAKLTEENKQLKARLERAETT